MKHFAVIFFISIYLATPVTANQRDLNALYYSDYRAIQRVLRDETKRVDGMVAVSNRRFISQISKYGNCRSNKWRAAFEIPLAELNERRKELNAFKRQALDQKGKMNSSWLLQAKAYELNKIQANQGITDFVIWYENFSSDLRQGPLQELELYTLGLGKLSDAYERMTMACAGAPSAANDTQLWVLGVRGLIAEVTGMLGLKE